MKKVLILFSYKSNKIADYDDLVRKLNERSGEYGYQLVRGAIKELEFIIQNGEMSVYDSMNQCDIADYDLVYYRMWHKEFERATATAQYLRSKGVPFFDDDVYSDRAFSKLTENVLLAINDIPIADSYFAKPDKTINRFKVNPSFDFPLVVKSTKGLKGRDNYLVGSAEELGKTINDNPEVQFIVQKFIPNTCDYRFLVLGDEIKLVIKRTRVDKTSHVNNTSQGAAVETVALDDFNTATQSDVLKAAHITRRDFSGVDVIIDERSGQHYLLEVNTVPEILSVFIDQKAEALHEYITKRLR